MPVNLYPVPISHFLRWCSRAFEGRFGSRAWEKLRRSVGRIWALTLTFAEKMWRKDDSPQTRRLIGKKQEDPLERLSEPTTPEPAEKQPLSQPPPSTLVAAGAADRSRSQPAIFGESLALTGTLSGREDVYVDGKVEGAIELQDGDLTVGPNGNVNANIKARNVMVFGRVSGDVFPAERMEIRKTGSFEGNVKAQRIIIEDGAVFRGSIDIVKPESATGAEPKPQSLSVRGESRVES